MGDRRKFVTAEEFCLSVRDGTHDSPRPVDVGRPLVTSKHITTGVIDLSKSYQISEDDYNEINTRSRVDQWDVLISMIGTVGMPCLVRETPNFAIKNVGLFKNRDEYHGKWLYYYLRSPEAARQIRELSRGTTQSYVPLAALRSFLVPLPTDANELRSVTNILGTLDDKIELNRQMNETLEAMARALFKSWFVDFDPVHAKAAGRQPSGMDAETAKLFPSEFEDSELGPIPKGWRATSLGDEVSRTGGTIQTGPFGSQLHASDYVIDGVPVVMPKDIGGRRVSTATIARIRERDAVRLSRHRLQSGDIVYSRRGDVERHALIGSREKDWLCGTGCLLVRFGPDWHSPLFTSLALDRPEIRSWISQHAIGATMPNLNTGILSKVPLVIPSNEILQAFNFGFDMLQTMMVIHESENELLAITRDKLMPRLLSGEISVVLAYHRADSQT